MSVQSRKRSTQSGVMTSPVSSDMRKKTHAMKGACMKARKVGIDISLPCTLRSPPIGQTVPQHLNWER